MALRDLMLEDLGRGLAMVRDGHEIVPTWRIIAPDGDYMIPLVSIRISRSSVSGC
jgi:hypothetical protein